MIARPLSGRADGASTRFLEALLAYDRLAAERIARQVVADGSSLNELYVMVLQPALYELGARWERNEISVAHEHYCTAGVQHIMAVLHADFVGNTPRGRRLLATAVGGNMHAVGIRMVADVFELSGWETIYLGADVPGSGIVEALSRGEIDVLAVSATLSEHVATVEELVAAVRLSAAGKRVKILVGGRPFNQHADLWKHVGADGHAVDPQQAVALAERLVATLPTAPGPRLTETIETIETIELPSPPRATTDDGSLMAMTELNNDLHAMARVLAAKNAELARVNAQLNRVMATIAHDLRNPLTVIVNYSQFLREDLDANLGSEQREYFDVIDESSDFMKRLMDDLLDVSRIRAGKYPLDLAPIELVSFMYRVLTPLEQLARRKSISLRFSSARDSVDTTLDPPKLQQVINNLVGNAIQYSPVASAVDVELDADDAAIRIAVHDRGLGIPESDLPKVFGAFETSATRGTAGEKSTGLGLAIVRGIVEAHGGWVSVDSKLGHGSTFFVVLPRHQADSTT